MVNLFHDFSLNPYRCSVELAWRNYPHNGAYHSLYNVEKYEVFKHFKLEENVNDSAVACMKVLYLERGNKVNCNMDDYDYDYDYDDNNNNNNNQMGCHPVAVVILHVHKYGKKVTRKFKSGGLHEMHVVATWKLGNNLNIRL